MGLNIKNEKAHRLAAQLAELTGESMTCAVTRAIQERIERLQRARNTPQLLARAQEVVRRAGGRGESLTTAGSTMRMGCRHDPGHFGLLAILFDEPEGADFLQLLVQAPVRAISAANMLEAWIVVDSQANPARAVGLVEQQP